MNRVAPLATIVLGCACLLPPSTARSDESTPLPVTGAAAPELAAIDRAVVEIIRKHKFPGASVAVARSGRLVLAHGYGLADMEHNEPVQPDNLFRIASVSKPITAAAILKLVESGRLSLDAKVLDLLPRTEPPPGRSMDPRWRQITVRRLLHHTAGFDRRKNLDPMCSSLEVATALGIPSPPDQKAIIRFMLGQSLDFDPGAKYSYSNFGYCLLGRIIEKVTGKTYEDAVKALVLAPAGIKRMRLGRTRLEERAAGEVRYYAPAGTPLGPSVFAAVKEKAPTPYGALYIDAMDAHGGWIASAPDLMRFVTAVDGSRKPGLLRPETVCLFASRPAAPLDAASDRYYGLGWNVSFRNNHSKWLHCGRVRGMCSMLVRTGDGLAWAALLNCEPADDAFFGELDRALSEALGQIRRWPAQDQFERNP